jgi:hypothetical protein
MKTPLFAFHKSPLPPSLLILALALACAHATRVAVARGRQQKTAPAAQVIGRTPSDTVRDFYRLMRERRFREAFALSVLWPAVEGMSAQELEEFKPDFEQRALEVPPEVVLTGEQVSGDEATVFMKLGTDDAPQVVPVFLVRERGAWLVGGADDLKAVKKQGKKFFYEARINAHHDEVENMMRRIATAQLIYSAQHGGQYADLAELVKGGLVPQDIQTPATTGYRFRVTPAGKAFSAGAEPARYGQTGRLSFYIDQTGAIRKEDKGGKPLK